MNRVVDSVKVEKNIPKHGRECAEMSKSVSSLAYCSEKT